ncbi:hypothetical protein T4B_6988 [Trichinella pseudospiralis]|uniref:Uncharacterized protein n=1 Tax=Trichinella pseudospiralis TaxID=6337 RepID=A0A0V1EQB5_TRIPS|nr:hypothetical protein T4A_11474 [Trichinella pseudospiralis]KRZ23229.1 hypothetical protein T4C_5708 [Trichinella pseudospiralis]KRZ28923.1 hypothetical protein T4B_6988 [Trichinella pseudospiralis]KRZ40710.1 hypothetical protein T4C_6780 [Trichinella pseudospiralis]
MTDIFSSFQITDLIGLRRLFQSLLPAKVAVLSTLISIGHIYIFERKDFMKSLHDNFHFASVHDNVYSPLWRTATENYGIIIKAIMSAAVIKL